jgi:hypothetical protein
MKSWASGISSAFLPNEEMSTQMRIVDTKTHKPIKGITLFLTKEDMIELCGYLKGFIDDDDYGGSAHVYDQKEMMKPRPPGTIGRLTWEIILAMYDLEDGIIRGGEHFSEEAKKVILEE